MVDIIPPLNQGMKRTGFRKRFFPEKTGSIGFLIRLSVIHAEHLFTLNAYHRFAGSGLQIVFKDPDG
jgi:hypothetical protein